jgi:hypothetical protein
MAEDVATPGLEPVDAALEARRARRGTLITLGVLAVLITVIVLLTPVSDNAFDTRLTTTKYGPGNARLAADLARRLGWQVRIDNASLIAPGATLDTTAIYAVFGGPTPLTLAERKALLTAVRSGAALLVAPSGDGTMALLDSLGLRTGKSGLVVQTPLGPCAADADPLAGLRVRTRMLTFDTAPPKLHRDAAPAVPYPRQARVLLASNVSVPDSSSDDDEADDTVADTTRRTAVADSARRPAAAETTRRPAVADTSTRLARPVPASTEPRPTVVAFALGRGRVVAMADPDVLRTDQLRSCAMGSALTVVRGLEYLSEGRAHRVIFAEYYQSDTSDGATVVVWEWLRFNPLGRAVLTLMGAAILLLLARGRRTLAPVYRAREERRSALEHVDALATAWQVVRGTRTVARMLSRGIRRRHAAGRWRTLDDTAFLAALAERHPAIADDAARLTRAMDTPVAPSDLPALREAAAHIDAECLVP